MAKVELKQPVIREISDVIKDAQAAVLVDHRGLTVAEDTELRRELRKEGVRYKVYKNTMMSFAFKDTDYEPLLELLEGPSALAVSETDPAAPARVLVKFAKKAKALELKGGVVEGKFYDKDALGAIAAIPSRDELLSKLLGSMQSPIANFARVVKQIAEQKAEGGEAPAEEAPAAEAAAPAAEEAPAAEAPAEETPHQSPAETASPQGEASEEAPAESTEEAATETPEEAESSAENASPAEAEGEA